MILRHSDANELDVFGASPLLDVETNLQCLVTTPTLAVGAGYLLIPEIIAIYSGGAGPFNLQIAWGIAFGSIALFPVTGASGFQRFKVGPFDQVLTPVQVTLPAGGVGIVGILLVSYIVK